jgi:hypothetical protein
MEWTHGVAAVIWIAGLIFAAGGGWLRLKDAERDINAVGSKLRVSESQRNDRHTRICIALLSIAATAEQKNAVLACLGQPEEKDTARS